MSSHKPTPQVYDGISTEEVPSAGFGWSRTPRTGVQIAGWISVFLLLMYNFGNHKGHVETVWLFVLAALLIVGLLIHLFQPKLNQVRTLTARNKPVGYKEQDWNHMQKTLTGPYAELSDDELRALHVDPEARRRELASSERTASINVGSHANYATPVSSGAAAAHTASPVSRD